MRQIAAHVLKNIIEPNKTIHCAALVDTVSAFIVYPVAWKNRSGNLNLMEQLVKDDDCGAVEINIEKFEPIYSEILFLDIKL